MATYGFTMGTLSADGITTSGLGSTTWNEVMLNLKDNPSGSTKSPSPLHQVDYIQSVGGFGFNDQVTDEANKIVGFGTSGQGTDLDICNYLYDLRRTQSKHWKGNKIPYAVSGAGQCRLASLPDKIGSTATLVGIDHHDKEIPTSIIGNKLNILKGTQGDLDLPLGYKNNSSKEDCRYWSAGVGPGNIGPFRWYTGIYSVANQHYLSWFQDSQGCPDAASNMVNCKIFSRAPNLKSDTHAIWDIIPSGNDGKFYMKTFAHNYSIIVDGPGNRPRLYGYSDDNGPFRQFEAVPLDNGTYAIKSVKTGEYFMQQAWNNQDWSSVVNMSATLSKDDQRFQYKFERFKTNTWMKNNYDHHGTVTTLATTYDDTNKKCISARGNKLSSTNIFPTTYDIVSTPPDHDYKATEFNSVSQSANLNIAAFSVWGSNTKLGSRDTLHVPQYIKYFGGLDHTSNISTYPGKAIQVHNITDADECYTTLKDIQSNNIFLEGKNNIQKPVVAQFDKPGTCTIYTLPFKSGTNTYSFGQKNVDTTLEDLSPINLSAPDSVKNAESCANYANLNNHIHSQYKDKQCTALENPPSGGDNRITIFDSNDVIQHHVNCCMKSTNSDQCSSGYYGRTDQCDRFMNNYCRALWDTNPDEARQKEECNCLLGDIVPSDPKNPSSISLAAKIYVDLEKKYGPLALTKKDNYYCLFSDCSKTNTYQPTARSTDCTGVPICIQDMASNIVGGTIQDVNMSCGPQGAGTVIKPNLPLIPAPFSPDKSGTSTDKEGISMKSIILIILAILGGLASIAVVMVGLGLGAGIGPFAGGNGDGYGTSATNLAVRDQVSTQVSVQSKDPKSLKQLGVYDVY